MIFANMTIKSRTEDLVLFLAVVDCGGFSVASRQLDVQVARVSRAVSRLEQELQCTLLNRTTRKLELTEEGRRFVDKARQGLAVIEEAEQALSNMQGEPRGRLRVDAVTPFIEHQLVPLVSEFRLAYPGIEMELTSHETIIDLLEHRTDVAIRIGALQDSNLHARFLGRSPLHLVASPDYLQREGCPGSIEALQQHSLIGFAGAPHLNRWPLTEPVTIRPSLSCTSGTILRQLCLAGQGIALLSSFMIDRDLATGRLIALLPGSVEGPNDRELVNAVYYRNTALASRIQVFLDFIAPRLRLNDGVVNG